MYSYPRAFRGGLIEPVVEVGQNLLLAGRAQYALYQVSYIEEIPASFPFIVNVGAIVAGVTAPNFNTNNILDMEYGQLGHFRSFVLDDINVMILQPLATARFGNKSMQARVNAFTALLDPCGHQTEIFLFEDDRPYLQVTNPQGYNLAQARIAFYGFKYVLGNENGAGPTGAKAIPIKEFGSMAEAERSQYKYTVIPIGGWGR